MLESLEEQIAGLDQQGSTDALRAHLAGTLMRGGQPVTDADLDRATALAVQYVREVPLLVEHTLATAAAVGETATVQPLVVGALSYFAEAQDLIPDHLGALGLLDDAYLCRRLLERLDDLYRELSGRALFATPLATGNRIVANMLGRDVAGPLDLHVQQAVDAQIYQAQVAALASRPESSGGQSWGGTFEDQSAQFFAEQGVSYNVDTQYVDSDGVQLY